MSLPKERSADNVRRIFDIANTNLRKIPLETTFLGKNAAVRPNFSVLDLSLLLPPKEIRSPGEAAAHSLKRIDRLFDFAVLYRRYKRERNRRSGRISVPVEGDDHLFLRRCQLSSPFHRDSFVRLVRNEPVDIPGRQIISVQRFLHNFRRWRSRQSGRLPCLASANGRRFGSRTVRRRHRACPDGARPRKAWSR